MLIQDPAEQTATSKVVNVPPLTEVSAPFTVHQAFDDDDENTGPLVVPGRDYLRTQRVLTEVAVERVRQTAKHGDQAHLPDGTGPDRKWRFPVEFAGCHTLYPSGQQVASWAKGRCKAASQNEGGDGTITFEHILTEEWGEAVAESDPVALRAELVQIAATAVQWIEAIDRRSA